MDLTHVLAHGRTWALYTAQKLVEGPLEVHLSTEGLDKAAKHFLTEIPKRWVDCPLENWFSKSYADHIVYDLHSLPDVQPVLLYVIVVEDVHGAYVALYDTTGKLYIEYCLVIWNKKTCGHRNEGYAPGRCPEKIDIHQLHSVRVYGFPRINNANSTETV